MAFLILGGHDVSMSHSPIGSHGWHVTSKCPHWQFLASALCPAAASNLHPPPSLSISPSRSQSSLCLIVHHNKKNLEICKALLQAHHLPNQHDPHSQEWFHSAEGICFYVHCPHKTTTCDQPSASPTMHVISPKQTTSTRKQKLADMQSPLIIYLANKTPPKEADAQCTS